MAQHSLEGHPVLKWLFGRRNQRVSAEEPGRIKGQNLPHGERVGRRGICIKCGVLKSGSFVDCPSCGFLPVSDRDLATSLALNEAEQGSRFAGIAEQIRSGATVQLSDADLEKSLRLLEKQGLIKILGRGLPRYVRQDKVEEILGITAQDGTDGFILLASNISARLQEFNPDAIILSALTGNAALRSLLRAMPEEADRDYVRNAFPHRFAKQVCKTEIFDADSATKAKILLSLPDVMKAVAGAELTISAGDPGQRDGLLAAIIFGDEDVALAQYLANTPGLFTDEIIKYEHKLDEKKYGAKL